MIILIFKIFTIQKKKPGFIKRKLMQYFYRDYIDLERVNQANSYNYIRLRNSVDLYLKYWRKNIIELHEYTNKELERSEEN